MAVTNTAPGPREGTVVFDDFSSGELDRDLWNVRVTGHVVNNEQQAYVDSPETIYVEREPSGNHVLALHPRYRPGHTTPDGRQFDFISGRIDTRDRCNFRYGAAEARIKLPAGRGVWPAFWMCGTGEWPDTGEVDIMECVGESDWVSSATHGPGYSGEAGLVNKWFFGDRSEATEWHTYGVVWSPGEMVFTVDGRTVYRVTRPMAEFFGPWAYDNEKFLILNVALGGTYPFKTNGLRRPYYGLGADAVEAIGRDDVRLLVDWVRVDGPGTEGR